MQPLISIIMGSTSDLPVMEKAAKFLDEMEVPFEINQKMICQLKILQQLYQKLNYWEQSYIQVLIQAL